jgi:hypothetical protein
MTSLPDEDNKKGDRGRLFSLAFNYQAVNDDPQPQVEEAFGFLITN